MVQSTILATVFTLLFAVCTTTNSWARTPECLTQQGQIGDLQHAPNIILDVFVDGKYVGSHRDLGITNRLMQELNASK